MATASRSRQPAGARSPNRTPNLTAVMAFDALRTWLVPGLGTAVIVGAVALGEFGVVPMAGALATTILAILVLLAYIGERPLLEPDAPVRGRMIGLAVAVAWVLAMYLPFHGRLFPGTPLVSDVQVASGGKGLPVHIPASG